MAFFIKVKETLQKIGKYAGQYRYVARVNQYSKISEKDVLNEAKTHSGLTKGQITGAWESIVEAIQTYVLQGHSVQLTGLGTLRLSITCKSAKEPKDVSEKMIERRRIIFTPDPEIKDKVKKASFVMKVVDRKGFEVERNPNKGSGGNLTPDDDDNMTEG